jgi:hypothetical protein
LHQLYLFGAAMQLNRMGYHMTKMNWWTTIATYISPSSTSLPSTWLG